MFRKPSPILFLLLATALSLFLNLYALDDISLWNDEGTTAVLAQTILSRGLPYISDGIHQICARGEATDSGLWIIHPWLQFYLAAASMFLFGKSIFVLRLPFALFGACCTPLAWHLGKRFKLPHPALVAATLLVATNIPLILLNRNARYYPLAAFFTLVMLLGYLEFRQLRFKYFFVFLFSAALFAHSMHISCFAVMGATLLHALIFERNRLFWKRYLAFCTGTVLLFAPFLILALSTLRGFAKSGGNALGFGLTVGGLTVDTLLQAQNLVKYNFPLLLTFPLIALYFFRKNIWCTTKDNVCLLIFTIFSICLVTSAVFPRALFPGYISGCLPLISILSAMLIATVSRNNRWLLPGLTLVVMLSNLLNLPWLPHPQAPLGDRISFTYADRPQRLQILREGWFTQEPSFFFKNYIAELSAPYEGPVEGIVQTLNHYAKPGERVFITNDIDSIYFLTGLKIEMDLPFTTPPEWIINRGQAFWSKGVCHSQEKDIQEYVNQLIRSNPYEAFSIPFPDFSQENMPVAPFHHRWDSRPYRNMRPVVLLHLKAKS